MAHFHSSRNRNHAAPFTAADTDGDGIPDTVELQFGPDRTSLDANAIRTLDGQTDGLKLEQHLWGRRGRRVSLRNYCGREMRDFTGSPSIWGGLPLRSFCERVLFNPVRRELRSDLPVMIFPITLPNS